MARWRDWLLNRVTGTFMAIAVIVAGWNLYVIANDDGVLVGRVVDPDGQAVADAAVTLSARTIVSLDPIDETRTDADGRFRFERHDRHALVVTARKDGLGESNRREVKLYFRNQNRQLERPIVVGG